MEATFAAGCFWHVEEAFKKVKGVKSTVVGYTGGKTKNPSYEQICTGKTGHVESVQVEYDPKEIPYKELLKVFWKCHDPTTLNRQGPDIGTQYRSVIFYHNQAQKKEAMESKKELQKNYKNKIVTEIKPDREFYKAEDYHQQYSKKHKMLAKLCGYR